MKTFNSDDIRKFGPCYDPNKYLPENWTGNVIDLLDIKEIPFADRLWVLMRTDFVSEKLMRLFVVWCARQVITDTADPRSIKALEVAEAFANGQATVTELNAAESVASSAARSAAYAALSAALSAASSAALSAASSAAYAASSAAYAARSAAYAASSAAYAARSAAYAASSAAWSAASSAASAAWSAASSAASAAQENKLREMLVAGIETGDVK